jgi:hypothetical protein
MGVIPREQFVLFAIIHTYALRMTYAAAWRRTVGTVYRVHGYTRWNQRKLQVPFILRVTEFHKNACKPSGTSLGVLNQRGP